MYILKKKKSQKHSVCKADSCTKKWFVLKTLNHLFCWVALVTQMFSSKLPPTQVIFLLWYFGSKCETQSHLKVATRERFLDIKAQIWRWLPCAHTSTETQQRSRSQWAPTQLHLLSPVVLKHRTAHSSLPPWRNHLSCQPSPAEQHNSVTFAPPVYNALKSH